MAHHHPVINFPLLAGSPSGQATRHNDFSNLPFPECTNELPLDLNFVQKLSQSNLALKNEVEVGCPNLLHQQLEQHDVEAGISDLPMPDGGTVDTVAPSKTPRSRCHWTHGDVMALFDAKKAQADKYEALNERVVKKGGKFSHERWDEVAEHCKSLGVSKQAAQCKDKWEKIWPAFRKIFDWERQLLPGKHSYWLMSGDEREHEGFPRVFDKELYDAMADRFGYVTTYDLASILVDSSVEESVIDVAADTGYDDVAAGDNPAEKSADATMYIGPDTSGDAAATTCNENGNQNDEEARVPGRKRKNRQLTAVEIKNSMNANDDKSNVKKDWQKSIELSDRKLSLEEKKLTLAEKKLLLEEKKLDVTIEIGRGLITSMERMTSAISTIGVFPAQAQT